MTTMNIPTIDMAATGRNIEFLRKQAGLSVRNLQDIFGFGTPQAIYKWQHGTAIPSVDNLVILAAILHVKVDDILVIEIPGSYKGGVTQGDTPSFFILYTFINNFRIRHYTVFHRVHRTFQFCCQSLQL